MGLGGAVLLPKKTNFPVEMSFFCAFKNNGIKRTVEFLRQSHLMNAVCLAELEWTCATSLSRGDSTRLRISQLVK